MYRDISKPAQLQGSQTNASASPVNENRVDALKSREQSLPNNSICYKCCWQYCSMIKVETWRKRREQETGVTALDPRPPVPTPPGENPNTDEPRRRDWLLSW